MTPKRALVDEHRYFKRDDLNAESFEDGWFKTGDIGQWDADGTMRIIDRVKNLVRPEEVLCAV